jgi:diguanylate cyclase (GGDEF)-like protein
MVKRKMEKLNSALAEMGFSPILNKIASLVVLVEADGSLVDWNPAFEARKACCPKATALPDLLTPTGQTGLQKLFRAGKGRPAQQGRVGFNSPGDLPPVSYDCLVLPLSTGQFLIIAEIANDEGAIAQENQLLRKELSEIHFLLKKKNVELNAVIAQADEVSHTDALTFLHNRRQILNLLQNEVTRADRYGTPLSVSMIDIDHFKNINDTFGHTEGDKVLVHLAKLFRQAIRDTDAVGRYGGEEFLVLLPNTNLIKAADQAARLCKRVREDEIPVQEVVHLTISIGIAQYKVGEENWQNLLTRADTAMYKAKHAGRDRWETAE